MTQDTEDVVALIARLRFLGKTEPCRNIGAVHEAADLIQSLSDRIDVQIELAEQAISAWAFAHGIDGAIRNELMARVRAALHQEGIAPGSDPLRFGVETRVNIARSQDTPDSRGDG